MKKTLMVLAIAACTASAQATTTYTYYAFTGWSGNGSSGSAFTQGQDVSYYKIYAFSASELDKLMGSAATFTYDSKEYKIADVDNTYTEREVRGTARTAVQNWLQQNGSGYNVNLQSCIESSTKIIVDPNGTADTVTYSLPDGSKAPVESKTGPAMVGSIDAEVKNDLLWSLLVYQDPYKEDAAYRIFFIGSAEAGSGRETSIADYDSMWNSFVPGSGNWSTATLEALPIPEPTSGMLMLLGLAGLCLRRKQRG